jgi:hypothetical protein
MTASDPQRTWAAPRYAMKCRSGVAQIWAIQRLNKERVEQQCL